MQTYKSCTCINNSNLDHRQSSRGEIFTTNQSITLTFTTTRSVRIHVIFNTSQSPRVIQVFTTNRGLSVIFTNNRRVKGISTTNPSVMYQTDQSCGLITTRTKRYSTTNQSIRVHVTLAPTDQ